MTLPSGFAVVFKGFRFSAVLLLLDYSSTPLSPTPPIETASNRSRFNGFSRQSNRSLYRARACCCLRCNGFEHFPWRESTGRQAANMGKQPDPVPSDGAWGMGGQGCRLEMPDRKCYLFVGHVVLFDDRGVAAKYAGKTIVELRSCPRPV